MFCTVLFGKSLCFRKFLLPSDLGVDVADTYHNVAAVIFGIFHENDFHMGIYAFSAVNQAVGNRYTSIFVQFLQHVFFVQHVKHCLKIVFMNRKGRIVQTAFKEINAVVFRLQFLVFIGRAEFNEGVCIQVHIINAEILAGQRLGNAGIGQAVPVYFLQFRLLCLPVQRLGMNITDADDHAPAFTAGPRCRYSDWV